MALTIHARRRIFYTLVVLFIVIGGGVVSYAQGWRIDFTNWHFEKIGGIYIRTYPENATIYLNGQPTQNQAGFLTPGTLISDLLPRTYDVSLKAAGYDDWQENAHVTPSVVTQFKYAVLVPTDGTAIPSSSLSTTLQSLTALQPTSTAIDPFDTNQKILIAQNKISVFDIARATTTTVSVLLPEKNLKATWLKQNLISILSTSGEFYLLSITNSNTANVNKLADEVKNFAATDDGLTIATLEKNSLEIFAPGDEPNYYRFNLPDIADAQSIIWYKDLTHLFIVYPDRVAFLDLADTNLINFTIIAHGTKPEYDPTTNTLYIIDSITGKLVGYDFPN